MFTKREYQMFIIHEHLVFIYSKYLQALMSMFNKRMYSNPTDEFEFMH